MIMKVLIPLILFVGINLSLAQDHKENLSGPYENIRQITEDCLMCHEEAGEEILKSNHWNWLTSNLPSSEQVDNINGKHIPVNSFCVLVYGNSTQCINCHLPFSKNDESFEFNSAENIDCLICHDQTGNYKRYPFGTGIPETEIDLLAVAQSVGNGKPKSENCGTCHFSGSGGVMMKSGAMDKSLLYPAEEHDYHLGGLGFGCGDCHNIKGHDIGSGSKPSCEDCHDAEPHKKELLNTHSAAISCQACHIPAYAITEPAITFWDWSNAGDDKESVKNEFGEYTYYKSMGELVWAKNIRPEYYWSNDMINYYQPGEKYTKDKLIDLNKPAGKISDPDSKIFPYKVMKSKQPYDPVNNYLIIPKIYSQDGYSKTFDWVSASNAGMKEINLEFSGRVDFIETKMYWPINHMVMSADNSLKCTSCHGKGGEGLLNWKELGYPDDPIKRGGRIKNKLIKE